MWKNGNSTYNLPRIFTLLALAIIFFWAITNFFGDMSDPSSCRVINIPWVTFGRSIRVK